MNLSKYISSIKNFPKPWIDFKDISPLLSSPEALDLTILSFEKKVWKVDKVVWLDARWFIFWSLLAYKLKVPFIMLRKKWKLPWECESIDYKLEYGTNTFEIQKQAIKKDDKVVIVDDLLATWGSVLAAIKLIEKLWWKVDSINIVVELEFLNAREKIKDYKINSLLKY